MKLSISWGRGAQSGSFTPAVQRDGNRITLFSFYTSGHIAINFGQLATKPCAFQEIEKRKELMNRLNQIETVQIQEDRLAGCPEIIASQLNPPGRFEQFIDVLSWVINELRA
jgi:hypothetical protein